MTSAAPASDPSWPLGDSEMARLMRCHDWAATPLGSTDRWPERIKAIVEQVLASPLVSSIAIGDGRQLIYNDAAARLYGARHPAALGRPLAETFPDSYPDVAALYDRVFAGESVHVAVQPLAVGTDGGAEVFDAYLSPVRDEGGAVVAAHMVGMEIGDRVRADTALRDSEARYRAFVNASADVIYRMSPDWSQMRALDGRGFIADTTEPSEDWRDVYLLPDDRPAIQRAIDHSIATRSMFALEHRVIRADGSAGWTASRAVPMFDDDGEIIEWIGTASDVTDRKLAEEKLRVSEAIRTVAIAGGRMGTWRWNLAARTVEGDARFMALWGFPSTDEAMPLAAFAERMSSDGQAQTERVVTEAVAANEEFDAEIEVASGPAAGHWLRWRGRAAPGDTTTLHGVSFDITEQKRAEAALRASENRLRDVLESMTDGFALLGPDFTILDVNEETLRVDGRRRDELIGRSHWAAFPGSEELPIGESFKRVMRDRMPAAIEHEYHWPDGQSLWIDARTYPTFEGGIAVFWRDITDRKQTEAALRESEEQQRLMLQLAPALLWSADPAGREISLNERWIDYTGQSEAETQNFGWLDGIHPDDLPETRAAFQRAFATGEPIEREHRIHKAGDGYRWHLVRHVPSRDDRGEIARWFGAAIDIDDLRRLQERQEVLVAELQHRVRNILTVVRSVFSRTVEAGGEPDEMANHFRGRLDALARTQMVTTRGDTGTADLENLIRDELLSVGVSDGPRLTIEGPDIQLPAKTAESIGLAIHELTTNALKYGALKVPDARLAISWATNIGYEDQRRLVITWSEQGVPALAVRPSRRGFGSELITEAIPYRLGAETKLEFLGGGIRCIIDVPLPGKKGRRSSVS